VLVVAGSFGHVSPGGLGQQQFDRPADGSLMGLMAQENATQHWLLLLFCFPFQPCIIRHLNNTYRLGKCLGAPKR
jgi:hypothetical protein